MSEYRTEIISLPPTEPEPELAHDEQFYCFQELVKKKGRRKKEDPNDYKRTYVPWNEINDSELITLVSYGVEGKEEMKRWEVLCRGLKRSELIGLILGTISPEDVRKNPVHDMRDRTSKMLKSNWRYIHTQLACNALCWECNDAKALECVLNNRELLKSEGL